MSKSGEVNSNNDLEERFRNNSAFPMVRIDAREFAKVPDSPIAFWLTPSQANLFARFNHVGKYFATEGQNKTSDNEKYLRFHWEVSKSKQNHKSRWPLCAKGGDFRKWAGNLELVIDWSDAARSFYRKDFCARIIDEKFWFKEGVTWTDITISSTAFRLLPHFATYETKGPSVFPSQEISAKCLLGMLNTIVVRDLLRAINPTVSTKIVDVRKLPFPDSLLKSPLVDTIVGDLLTMAQADWDNFETSWDFLNAPLLRPGLKGATMEASWRNWEAQSTVAIRRMQELETENNRLFIAAYGLEGELEPAVPEEQITLARADARRDMAAFLSYAIGCMMGRYSLDAEGLILADAGDTADDYLRVVNEKWGELDEESGITEHELIFPPDADGIIPMLDGEWFEDDIVARTKDFLRATFDDATLAENLRFIEKSLGRELRDYFLTDFYKDHLQTYKNRPIYWLFSSGKQKAFQCLVYLHRYTPATLARIRTEYVIPLQGKLAARITRLEEEVTQTSSSAARKKLQTDLDKYKKQLVELLAFDEQLRSYADQAITLDLDDGVKTNYAKFGPLVAESKKVCGTKED
jgi:hypothetical protein